MSQAFTAGVKLGGLTTSSQIRILLCYLLKISVAPLTQREIELALLGEQLVNLFELCDALSELEQNGFAVIENGAYSITEKGGKIADTLITDVPKAVRECAVSAVVKAQSFTRKEAQHKAEITSTTNGFFLNCYIEDMGQNVFSFSIYMPDLESAEHAKRNFIENGDKIYSIMLTGLTGNIQLAAGIL